MKDRIHELLQEDNYHVCIDFIRKNYNKLLTIDKNDLYNLFKHIYLLEDDVRIIFIIRNLNLGTYDLFPYEELSKCLSEGRMYTAALNIIDKYICLFSDHNTEDIYRARALKEDYEVGIKEGGDCSDRVDIIDKEDIEMWGLRFLVSGEIDKVVCDEEYKIKMDETSEMSEVEIGFKGSNCENKEDGNETDKIEKGNEEETTSSFKEECEMREETSEMKKQNEELENKISEIKNSQETTFYQKRQKLTKIKNTNKKEQIQKELTTTPFKIQSNKKESLILSKFNLKNLKIFRCEKLKEKNSKIKFTDEKCIKTIKGSIIYLKASKKTYKLSKITLENYLFVNSNSEKFVKFSIVNFKRKYFYVTKHTKPLKILKEENLCANLKIFKNFLGIAKFLVKKQFLIADRLMDSLLFHEKKGLVLNCFNLNSSNDFKLYREILEIIYLLSKNCQIPNIKTLNFENNKKYKTFMRHEILNLIKIYTQKIKERIIFD